MKVLFDTKKVQKLGRIALTDPLLRNAGLQEGDEVNIYFDVSTKQIILEAAKRRADERPIAEDVKVKRRRKAP